MDQVKVVAPDRRAARRAARAKVEATGLEVVRLGRVTNVVFPVWTRKRVWTVEVETK